MPYLHTWGQNHQVVHQAAGSERLITANVANAILAFGDNGAGGAKAMDITFYGSDENSHLKLDSSADTFTSTAIAWSVGALDAPAAVATATGTAATALFAATGGVGGGTTIATTGTGGVGGGFSFTAGAGGVASAAATAATGGAGGAFAVTTGAGGAEAIAGVTSTGGAGGAITFTTGAGGAVSAAVSGTATGGASGAISLLSGTGGAVTATTGTNVGGASGAVTVGTGVGGAASAATDTGGASGILTLKTGTGGVGDTGGASGNIVIQTGAAGAGGSPTVGSILFEPGTVESARITGLKVFIGDSVNTKCTQGLTIKQGTNDDEILALKSADVAHGATTDTEADSFGVFTKAEAATGGLFIGGFKDGDGSVLGSALHLRGVLDETAADTTKSTAGVGVVTIDGCLEGSNTAAVVGSDENLCVIRNFTTTRFIFDGEGSAHGDVEFVAFDEHNDVALLDALEHEFAVRRGDEVKMQFGAFAQEHKDALQRNKIVNFYDKDGKRGMVNFSRLAMLHTGAIRQMARRLETALETVEKVTNRLADAEARLKALPNGKA